MRITGIRRILSLVTIVPLVIPLGAFPFAALTPATLAAEESAAAPAGIYGTILISAQPSPAAAPQPVAGAVVKVRDIGSGRSFESKKTDELGSYSLASLPAGTYEMVVQTGRGLFLSDGTVGLGPGQRRRVSFALQEDPPPEGGKEGGGEPGDEGKEKPKEKEKNKKAGWADHPWIAGAIVAGSAIALGVLADQLTDEEKQASPSSPQ